MMKAKDRAVRAAAAVYDCSPDELWADDLTVRYAWIRRSTLFWAQRRKGVGVLVAVCPDQEVLVFRFDRPSDEAANLDALNRLLVVEAVTLPADVPEQSLALTVRAFLRGPRGVLAAPSFLEEQGSSLALWVPPEQLRAGALPDWERRIASYCDGPRVEQTASGWQLAFHYFNASGGVEAWEVTGTVASVQRATCTMAEPNDTLRFPYA